MSERTCEPPPTLAELEALEAEAGRYYRQMEGEKRRADMLDERCAALEAEVSKLRVVANAARDYVETYQILGNAVHRGAEAERRATLAQHRAFHVLLDAADSLTNCPRDAVIDELRESVKYWQERAGELESICERLRRHP